MVRYICFWDYCSSSSFVIDFHYMIYSKKFFFVILIGLLIAVVNEN